MQYEGCLMRTSLLELDFPAPWVEETVFSTEAAEAFTTVFSALMAAAAAADTRVWRVELLPPVLAIFRRCDKT